MIFKNFLKSIAVLCLMVALPSYAETFPEKPIKLMIAFPPGGPTDATMRSLAENASKILGKAVIIENKPGAGGTMPIQLLQTADPDGYTLAQLPLGIYRLPYITKVNWNPINDVSHVLNVTGYAFGVVVSAESQINTWEDLVKWAHANPGKLTYGSTGTLTTPHLTMEAISEKLNIELSHIPYKGSADLMQALLGGHIMAAADSTGFAPLAAAGKVRVLNTWGEHRLAKFPNAPTLKELGLDMIQNSPFGIAAPKNTPPHIIKLLHDAFKLAMEQENFKNTLSKFDMVPMYMNTIDYKKFAERTYQSERKTILKFGFAIKE